MVTNTSCISQMRKVRLGEVQHLIQDHTAQGAAALRPPFMAGPDDGSSMQVSPRAASCMTHTDVQQPLRPAVSEPRGPFPPHPLGTELAPLDRTQPLRSPKLGNDISPSPESGPSSCSSRKGKPTTWWDMFSMSRAGALRSCKWWLQGCGGP